ncbi:hypothetical protein LTR86_009293 [Recurvomyces mirabilis]|nr:hypothetical protein LTR86_009293 [Recurvomyces mirabilis]
MTARDCPHNITKWVVLGVGESVFEIGFVASSIWNIWSLHTTRRNKLMVVALFAIRLPYVVTPCKQTQLRSTESDELTGRSTILIIAIQLSVFGRHAFSNDPLLQATSFICISQLVLSYSICTANFPAFRRVANDIRTDFGGFGTARSRRPGNSSTGYIRATTKGQPLSGQEPEYFPATNLSKPRSGAGTTLRDVPLLNGDSSGYSVEARGRDGASITSDTISDDWSDQMIIRTRKDVVVSRGPRAKTEG